MLRMALGCAMAAATIGTAKAAEPADTYPSSDAHYAALKRKAGNPGPVDWRKLPDWTGIWVKNSPRNANPPLNAKAAAIFAATVAKASKGEEWDYLSDCLPSGFPRMLGEPFEREFIVRPETVWLHNVNAEETRRIYTDGRDHLPEDAAYPLWEGDSVGFWDGDTLVIHTNHVRAYPQGYNRSGPPSSEKLTAVETWRKIDPDHIEVRATFYDPEYLTQPWAVVHRYERVAKGRAIENRADQWVCNENSNVERTASGATRQLLPGESGYRDPNGILNAPTAQ